MIWLIILIFGILPFILFMEIPIIKKKLTDLTEWDTKRAIKKANQKQFEKK